MASVKVEVQGIDELLKFLKRKNGDVSAGVTAGLNEAGDYVSDELQASIAGQRSEPRSVDTGRFLNSINIQKVGDFEVQVGTPVDYALFLEYGTFKLYERRHFRNTAARSGDKVTDILKVAVKQAI